VGRGFDSLRGHKKVIYSKDLMPEYFDISLITEKRKDYINSIRKCLLEKFNLEEGENESNLFGGKKVLVSFLEDDLDFKEVLVSVPEHIFHRETFEQELKTLTLFINDFFLCCEDAQFAFCSYELNGYLLRDCKKLQDFNTEILKKFPIVYKREVSQKLPILSLNFQAQEIFDVKRA
jgi:hypothetical protein